MRMLSAQPEDRPVSGQQIADELAEIARDHDLSSSPAAVTAFLQQLFPETATSSDTEPLGVKELVRVSDSMPSVKGTPSYGAQLPPIDVSETFRRSGFNMVVPRTTESHPIPIMRTTELPRAQSVPPVPSLKSSSSPKVRLLLWTLVFIFAAVAGYFYMMPR